MSEVEELDNLPFREGYNKSRLRAGEWSARKSECHKVGDYYPWTIAERVIKSFIGKPFNKAFSYFCTLVPVYQQHIFLEEFQPKRWRNRGYYLDKGNNIRIHKEHKDKSVWFYPIDYECKIERTRNGRALFYWEYEEPGDVKKVTETGFKKKFSSKKEPEYKKLVAEKLQQMKKIEKEKRKERTAKDYIFLTQDEQQKINDQLLDNIRRDAHGFDEESFMCIEYHGKKRKRKS
jgi:hypothetical protein